MNLIKIFVLLSAILFLAGAVGFVVWRIHWFKWEKEERESLKKGGKYVQNKKH